MNKTCNNVVKCTSIFHSAYSFVPSLLPPIPFTRSFIGILLPLRNMKKLYFFSAANFLILIFDISFVILFKTMYVLQSLEPNLHKNCVYKNNKLVLKCGITIFICVFFLKYSNTHLLPNHKCLFKLK